MPLATPTQIRAARAMLDWSMMELAEKAGVSISSVKRYESEQGAPASIGLMQDALETEGIQFLKDDGTGPGIRLKERRAAFHAVAHGRSHALSNLL